MENIRKIVFILLFIAGIVFVFIGLKGIITSDNYDAQTISQYTGLIGLGCFLAFWYIAKRLNII
jgi:cbb3-type cytochrome oxidase subunit 3